MELAPSLLPVAAAIMSFSSAGCMAKADAPEMAVDVPFETMDGPNGNNGLPPRCLWHQDTLNALSQLSTGSLLNDRGEIVQLPPLDTDCGLVYQDLFKCAMPYPWKGTGDDGTEFQGIFGAAPRWADSPLDASGKRWVTACMLQHLNGVGATIPIMLEGDNPGLVPIPGQNTSSLTLEDATMFGNLFDGPRQAFACWESENRAGPCLERDMQQDLDQRICDGQPACNLTILGHCSDIKVGTSNGNGFWEFPQYGYTETIRSIIDPRDAAQLYPGCF